MTDGGVQSLQAVWFTTGQSIKPVGDLYVAVFGNPAAAIQSAGINSMAAGVDGQTAIRLQVSPNRVDLILSAQAPRKGKLFRSCPISTQQLHRSKQSSATEVGLSERFSGWPWW